MVFTLDGQLRLSDAPNTLRKRLMVRLTVPNPDYDRALYMGRPTWGIPRDLMLFKIDHNELILPRGMAVEVWRLRPRDTQKRDCMTRCPAPDWPPAGITLRDYQKKAIDAVRSARIPQGVLIMPCGAGKTETGLYLIREIGQPALWITHTQDLVRQTAERAADRLGLYGEQLGIIAAGKRSIGTHLTVATVQSLYNMDLDELAGRVGTVIVDECQHVVANPSRAEMFNAVLACLPARYRYGLTATPARGDGLEGTIYMILGDALHEVTQSELERTGNTVLPTVEAMATAFCYAPSPREQNSIDVTRLRRCMAADPGRTRQIVDAVCAQVAQGHVCLVLAATLAALEDMCRAVAQRDAAAAIRASPRFIHGGTRAADRIAALGELRAGTSRCLFATYQLAKEGLDIPRADRLILAQPVRDSTTVRQSVGRIMRPAPGKRDAAVLDFVDVNVKNCKNQYAARKRVYRQMDLNIKEDF